MRKRPEAPRPAKVSDQRLAALFTQADVDLFLGDNQKDGFPLFTRQAGAGDSTSTEVMATFCWVGDSETEWVFLDANGLTDRDWLSEGMLDNVAGTNLWHISLMIPAQWRGSYCFLIGDSPLVEPNRADQIQRRNWWLSLLESSSADPLNPVASTASSFGFELSETGGPDAPAQGYWDAGENATSTEIVRHRMVLAGVERDVWSWCSPVGKGLSEAADGHDLVIVFDGRTWAERHSLGPALGALVASRSQECGRGLVVVMVDSVDQKVRSRDLTCSDAFRVSLADVVVPWAHDTFGATLDPKRIAIAGQSYGGLAAADFVLQRSDVAKNAICLSASFWWTGEVATISQQDGWIWGDRLAEADRSSVWFWIRAGLHEGDMAALSERFATEAGVCGAAIDAGTFCGGHDGVQWREALLGGIARFLGR